MSEVWHTDRSRIETGTDHCQMARYLRYHWGGHGITPAKPSLDSTVGTALHGMLVDKLRGAVTADWPARVAAVAVKRKETEHSVQEQVHLTKALAYGWERAFLESGWLAERYEVVCIEQEFPLSLDDDRIQLNTKPDLVLRSRATGKLCIADWKTTTYITEGAVDSYRDNVQLALLTAAVELATQEEVPTYLIFALQKGQRRVFKSKGQESPEKRQMSSLCYALGPEAPYRKDWTVPKGGDWYMRQPVWSELSAQEWVAKLPKEVLFELFQSLGPYDRPTHMIQQALRSVVGEENRWIDKLWRLHSMDKQWGTQEFEVALDGEVARSYGHCNSFFGDHCPYQTLCFKLPGWDNPTGSDLYRPRRPHHEPELVQLQAAGMAIPPEPWE